ncbi:MAG: hypothetical protein H7Y00_04705, partial [Fimbriimonadaceae bacterium]|nr:hypothetical protein [Chitinophagales bacterium]
MKNFYKKTLVVTALIFSAFQLHAQWCIPETAIPYNANMPGITNVVLNTINRNSTDLENYPANSYVYTELSTTLVKGSEYEMSISFTIDASICPDMNIRVWIDYNMDGTFDDEGEIALSEDHLDPGTFTGSFIIPEDAIAGTTRLRATAKMTSNGGHTLPTPCDIPADPFGYHGEFEDYDVVIEETSLIDNENTSFIKAEIYPNPAANEFTICYTSQDNENLFVRIVSLTGEVLFQYEEKNIIAGVQKNIEIN